MTLRRWQGLTRQGVSTVLLGVMLAGSACPVAAVDDDTPTAPTSSGTNGFTELAQAPEANLFVYAAMLKLSTASPAFGFESIAQSEPSERDLQAYSTAREFAQSRRDRMKRDLSHQRRVEGSRNSAPAEAPRDRRTLPRASEFPMPREVEIHP